MDNVPSFWNRLQEEMDLQRAIQSFINCSTFLCNHCEAGCETPLCKTVIESKEAIAFLKGAKNTEQQVQADSVKGK